MSQDTINLIITLSVVVSLGLIVLQIWVLVLAIQALRRWLDLHPAQAPRDGFPGSDSWERLKHLHLRDMGGETLPEAEWKELVELRTKAGWN